MQLKRSRFAFVLLLLTGCAGLIGVPDLTLQEEPEDGGLPDGNNASTDGQSHLDGTTDTGSNPIDASDAGTDSATCDLAKTSSDPMNCGSCGHICLDDAGCAQSKCGARIIATLTTDAGVVGINEMIESGSYLYAATDTYTDSDAQGVYRINKSTGHSSLYAKLGRAQKMVVIGEYLWMNTYSSTYDVADPGYSNGGIFRCKLVAGDSCAVELVEPVNYPEGLTSNGTDLYYADYGRTEFRKLDTTKNFIPDGGSDAEAAIKKFGGNSEIGNLYEMFVDPGATPDTPTTYFLDEYAQSVVAYRLNQPGGSSIARLGKYPVPENPTVSAFHGNMVGTPKSVYWAASDYYDGLGGTVKRINRTDDTSCDLGNLAAGKDQVFRPQGMFVDAKNVFWANRGEWGVGAPKGSIAMCPVDTCCTEANFVWNGTGQPWAVTGDQTRLYWSVYTTGEIYTTTKP